MPYVTKVVNAEGHQSIGFITPTLEEAEAYARLVHGGDIKIYESSRPQVRVVSYQTRNGKSIADYAVCVDKLIFDSRKDGQP